MGEADARRASIIEQCVDLMLDVAEGVSTSEQREISHKAVRTLGYVCANALAVGADSALDKSCSYIERYVDHAIQESDYESLKAAVAPIGSIAQNAATHGRMDKIGSMLPLLKKAAEQARNANDTEMLDEIITQTGFIAKKTVEMGAETLEAATEAEVSDAGEEFPAAE